MSSCREGPTEERSRRQIYFPSQTELPSGALSSGSRPSRSVAYLLDHVDRPDGTSASRRVRAT